MFRLTTTRRTALSMLAAAFLTFGVPDIVQAQLGSTPVRVVNPDPIPVTVTNLPASSGGTLLGPAKASDLVALRSSGALCAPSPWRKLDTQINGDGTVTPFMIPGGKVLIVTSIDFRQGLTGASGAQEEFFLFPSADNINVNLAIVDIMSAPGSSDGRAGTSTPISGVAIKAGNPCWGVNRLSNMGSADAIVRGYLAADE